MKLRPVKLIVARIVEEIERHTTVDPVIVGLQDVIFGEVLQALRLQNGRIEPVRELQNETLPGFRRNDFMVANQRNGIEPNGAIWLSIKSCHSML